YSREKRNKGMEHRCATRTGAWIINKFIHSITNVTARRLFFCYTAVNAFATVCSLSGDPVGSASPAHFLPAVWFQRQFHCERHANSDQCVLEIKSKPLQKEKQSNKHI